jgi:hypothetical protein
MLGRKLRISDMDPYVILGMPKKVLFTTENKRYDLGIRKYKAENLGGMMSIRYSSNLVRGSERLNSTIAASR